MNPSAPSSPASLPPILVISSHVVRGSVGGRAASFTLERLGHPVWSVQTVTLPWHPGHGRADRILPSADAFARLIDDLRRAPWLAEIGGILTGYIGEASQVPPIAALIDAVKATRPDALYLCDPIVGDNGELYVPAAVAEAIRDHLVPRADWLTPNPTELAFLVGRPLPTTAALVEAAAELAPRWIAITSAAITDDRIETWLVGAGAGTPLGHARQRGRAPNGTGDLFAAGLLARLTTGIEPVAAMRSALAAVVDAIDLAADLGADELPLAAMGDQLAEPVSRVE